MAGIKLSVEVSRCEGELLEASQRIRSITHGDSLVGWIIEVLETNEILSHQLHLPTNERVRKALLTILRSDSQLKHPIVTILAQRIAAFVATVGDVSRHPLCSEPLTALETNCQTLLALLDRYQLNYERRKTIKLVRDALEGQRLHIYKSTPQEPDLRVALRAFYEDSSRDDKGAINYVLAFILEQLMREVRKPGHISQPRHAWWAVYTLFKEGSARWITANNPKLNKVIRHLLEKLEYVPGRDMDYTSIVPELHSPENEEMWMAINAIGIYTCSNASALTGANTRRIAGRIEASITTLLQDEPQLRDLKYLQSRMIMLYEALRYYGLQYAIRITKKSVFDLSSALIGGLYYAEPVVQQTSRIILKAEALMRDTAGWTKATLGSVLLSGAPGQGKSELGLQIIEELRKTANRLGKTFATYIYAVGKEINNENDLTACLDRLRREESANTVRCVMFDEFDKASFNFYAPFLPHLEEPAKPPVTFWLFAQSTKETAEELRNYAAALENKSMRDFLTRMQLGTIDMSHVKFSVEQRICTAIGLLRTQNPSLRAIQADAIIGLAQWPDVTNNRDIRRVITSDMTVINNVVSLSGRRRDYLDLWRVGKADATIVALRL